MSYQATLVERAIARADLQHGVGWVSGWRTRGSSVFNPRGVVCHHDASNRNSGDDGALNMIIHGGRDFPGPYGNFQLARKGRAWVVAAGRANHAGKGGWRGLTGNSSVFGIEAANDGLGEPWTPQMLDTYYRLVNALLAEMGQPTINACAHREWSPGRKPDPRFIVPGMTMDQFRAHVAANGGVVTPGPEEEVMWFRFMKAEGDSRIFAVHPSRSWHLSPTEFKEMMNGPTVIDNRVWEISPRLLSKVTGGAYQA